MESQNSTTFPTTIVDFNTTITFDNVTTSSTTQSSTEFLNTTTAVTTTSTTPEPPGHAGVIAGGVCGGIIVLALLIGVAVFFFIRRRRRKRKKRKEKIDHLPQLPSIADLEKEEIKSKIKKKERWSEKDKPDKEKKKEDPHYVNERIGTLPTENRKSDPLYIQPEPPTREIYSGPNGVEYYMDDRKKSDDHAPTEVYSDANIPEHNGRGTLGNIKDTSGKVKDASNKVNDTSGKVKDKSGNAKESLDNDTSQPEYTNSNGDESTLRDYENAPAKRIQPPKVNHIPTDDEEQTVYENT
ncbi:uncharacterized protein [Argopecten irradians]|uniref:uncharacterized protein isoform X1 n=1 Tax=Argopecten irradians TaxID=31199 RepID=UPI00372012D7